MVAEGLQHTIQRVGQKIRYGSHNALGKLICLARAKDCRRSNEYWRRSSKMLRGVKHCESDVPIAAPDA